MEWEFEFLQALQSMHSEMLDKIMLFITSLGDVGAIWIVAEHLQLSI